MIAYIVAVILVGVLLSWLWRTNRDPLVYLVPPVLAFSPLVRYAGETLGWAGGWLSVRKGLVLALGISLAFRFLKGDYAWRRIPGMAYVAPYLCLVLLSVLWSVVGPSKSDAAEIFDEFIDWALPVTVFICLAASPSSERRIASAGRVMGFTVLTLGIYGGLQLLVLLGQPSLVPGAIVQLTEQGQQDFWWGPFRVYGPFASLGPNAFGTFLLLPVAYTMTRYVDTRGAPRFWWAVASLIGVALILGTYSRGAELGLLVIALTLPLLRRSARGFGFVAIALLGMVSLLAGTRMGQHIEAIYRAGQWDPDIAGRLAMWRVILQQIPDHLLGFGFDGWARGSQHLIVTTGDPLIRVGAPFPADNQWMRELADRGIPGVLLLAVAMAGLIGLAVNHARDGQALPHRKNFLMAAAAGFTGWCLAFSAGDHLSLSAVAGMFWYVAGIALAAVRDDASPTPANVVDPVAFRLHIPPAESR